MREWLKRFRWYRRRLGGAWLYDVQRGRWRCFRGLGPGDVQAMLTADFGVQQFERGEWWSR